ncbi:unnamed protein product [Kuraishia capsulata CBS 1993]|uniref:rRNA adenine N(6)-methyltransferase n=1 Tax=Kuraishia capsulata CBS 1993 TaxID=1382522 RepID=W6MV12_9ASCO|nr:uncharacterized protein KUCA_T00005705001 [Kuraishia capsulata CBS 1993]CDK29712.1 unnamed protein product [Kuraishia capsulata CBS 1993]
MSRFANILKTLSLPKHLYGYSVIGLNESSSKIVSKLNLNYQNPLIVDLYSGVNGFAFALHEHLKPRKHILMEDHAKSNEYLSQVLEKLTPEERDKFVLSKLSSFNWSAYTQLEGEGIIDPDFVSRNQIHPSFLIHGNLCYPRGEALLMQFYTCLQDRNWLQKYGRVRMLFWTTDDTAAKVIPKLKKKRMGFIAEKFSTTKLIAMSDKSKTKDDDAVLFEHPEPLCLIQVEPKNVETRVAEFNIVSKKLCNFGNSPVRNAISTLGAGAPAYFGETVPERILDNKVIDLTLEELDVIVEAYWRWPFKPMEGVQYMDSSASFYD